MYKLVLFSAVFLLLLGFSTISAATITVTVELKDGSGAYITSGATLRYNDGTWKTDATNNGNGTWTINTSASSLYYEMTYNYGVQQIGPTSTTITTITFRTTTTTVRLEKADHTGLAGGVAQYTQGGAWHSIGNTTGGNAPSVELLPVSYYFGMTFNYGYQQFSPLTIPSGGGTYTVTFTTTATTVRLETSGHVGLDGGVARYTPGGTWHNIGATSGGNAPVVDLLPGSYYFDMDYNHGHQQLGPTAVSGASQVIVFTTTATTVRLETSLHAGLDGGTARYNQGAWWGIGMTTGGNAPVIQLLPGSYFFDMTFKNGKQQVGPLAVTGNTQTVTFQTTKVTVRLENCSHTGFAGGVARYNQGTWNALPNTDANGNTSIELLQGIYHFDMVYNFGQQLISSLAIAGAAQTVTFQTTKVTIGSPGTTEYHQGAWHTFTSPIELLPGSYYFRIAGSQVGPYAVSGCTFYRAFITVELRNGAGGFIASGASLRYHDGSWKTNAVDNHNGTFSVVATAPSVYYEMTYNHGKQQIGPYPATTSPVIFRTTTTTVRLENSAHTGFAGGVARFNQGAWFSFGTTGVTGDAPPMELLPGSYYFDMDFNHGHQQLGPLTISGNAQTVLFQTTTTTVQLLSGGVGSGLGGGIARFNQGSWHSFGTTADVTGLTGAQELLPGSYYFDMVFNNGRQQIGPTKVAGNAQTIPFTTTTTTIRLESGGGGGGLLGGVARFNQGTWQPAGTTGTDGNITPAVELLPGSYYFDMVYNNGRQQIGPMNITGLTQTVPFTTTTTTVRLENCGHTGFSGGEARYHQSTWNSFGTTGESGDTPPVELLPGSYYFDMNYNYGRQQLGPLAVAGNTQTVLFQTMTAAISGTGTTEYHQGAWHTFTSPIELLPGSYYFREDGNQVGPLSVPGCNFSGSFVKGKGTLAAQYGSPTVDIDANVSAGEPAGGTFRITYATGTGHPRAGVVVSGDIVCMRLGDNIVYLAGLVQVSNSNEWKVGQYVRFGIQDESPDKLNYTMGEDSKPDCDTFSQTADLSLAAGGYTILILGGESAPAVPNVSAGADKQLNCTIVSATLDGSSSTTGATASWNGPSSFTSNSFTPAVSLPGTYTLTVTGPNGCKASDEVLVSQNITAAIYAYCLSDDDEEQLTRVRMDVTPPVKTVVVDEIIYGGPAFTGDEPLSGFKIGKPVGDETEAMARDGNTGTTYIISNKNKVSALFKLNLQTGYAYSIGYTYTNSNDGIGDINALAFNDQTNELYGITVDGDRLLKIDITTAEVTEYPESITTMHVDLEGASFDYSVGPAQLYVISQAKGEIFRVNMSDGLGTLAGKTKPGMETIEFAKDGRLHAANNDGNIYEINRETYIASLVALNKKIDGEGLVFDECSLVLEKSMASRNEQAEIKQAEEVASAPTEFALHQNYPNPFNPVTQLQFDLPKAGTVKLAIYDIVGNLVRTLVSGEYAAGRHRVTWDATNEHGVKVGSGVYFYRFESNQFVSVKRMVLMK